jgi:hypothetical protein
MAIGAGGGIMAGPMGNPMGNQQPVAAPPVMNEEPMMSDSGEDMAQVQNEEATADTGQLAQALSNVSPDAKESLTNITKGQADAMTQVLANLGINPEESNAVFSKFGVGKESGLIIPTAEVMENPEGVKSKIDQFVMAMSNQADSGMMTSNTPSGVDEANMTNRVPPTQPV